MAQREQRRIEDAVVRQLSSALEARGFSRFLKSRSEFIHASAGPQIDHRIGVDVSRRARDPWILSFYAKARFDLVEEILNRYGFAYDDSPKHTMTINQSMHSLMPPGSAPWITLHEDGELPSLADALAIVDGYIVPFLSRYPTLEALVSGLRKMVPRLELTLPTLRRGATLLAALVIQGDPSHFQRAEAEVESWFAKSHRPDDDDPDHDLLRLRRFAKKLQQDHPELRP